MLSFNFCAALTAAFALIVAPAGASQQKDCAPKNPDGIPSTAEPQVRSLQQQLKASPFYEELEREFGKPLSCTVEFDDGKIGLTYAFRGHAQLMSRIDPKIETSEQRIQIPRMQMKKAIALLKAAEKDAYRPNGCGITWDHPAEQKSVGRSGSREAVYRGDTCNCQARVTSRNNYAVSLVLKSAC